MIALDPAQDAPHWRLGIAYYFTGQFAKSARQFEKYHAYDGATVRTESGNFSRRARCWASRRRAARCSSIRVSIANRFPRSTRCSPGQNTDGALRRTREQGGSDNDAKVMFFANYYAGLNEALLGHRDAGPSFLRKAVASPWGRTAEGGPAYMWQVARLHYERHVAGSR